MIKKIYFFIFLICTTYIFDGFTNSYIILNNNYESRMVKNAGYCNSQGYGFVKKVIYKFPDVKKKMAMKNYANNASARGYFYDLETESKKSYLIILNLDEKNLEKYTKNNYTNIYSEQKCYLLKKND